jgi:hypothetical protein
MSNRIASLILGLGFAVLAAAPALAGDNDWTKMPPRSFDVKALKIDGLVGGLTIDVKGGGPAVLEISGAQWRVKQLSVKQSGNELRIEGSGGGDVWNWKQWFDFSNAGKDNTRNLNVHLIVPKGIAIAVDGMIGKAVIGDTYGPMKFDTSGSADARIGNVANAEISVAGSGRVTVGNVGGDFKAETAGAGDILAGNIGGEANADIAGSGSVSAGQVARGVHIEIAGSGDFTAASVNGQTHIEIAGSGSVNIKGGEANPFDVEIMGSGDVSFGGIAVNPHIESMGSGNVTIKAYRGNLSNEGNSHLKIGG